MALHKSKRGLRLPINGAPEARIEPGAAPRRVALLGHDYVSMKPTMRVQVGDSVKRGQVVFEDKKTEGVRFTAPAAGKVVAINRGERRAFQSLVIELGTDERSGRSGAADEASYRSFSGKHPTSLTAAQVRELLLESGQWAALRARPFGRVADPAERPHSIFVTAVDSDPLGADPMLGLEGRESDLQRGLAALTKLTDGPVYVCTGERGLELPPDERVRVERFSGPHPSGTVGYHIHTLDPVDRNKLVWYLGVADAVAIGHLLDKGKLDVERTVALAGPRVARPRLIRTRVGAALADLVDGELEEGPSRVISGSIFSGSQAAGEIFGYLGRFHQQISVLAEDRERQFLGWLGPGLDKFSVVNAFLSKLMPGKRFDLTTSTNGSQRAVVPIGVYEKVTPHDLMASFLARALLMRDVERAEELGCLELDEEDVALLSFVCPGKNDYGPPLREILTLIEKEG